MMTFTISVPDELAEVIMKWENGATYNLVTKQTAPPTETTPGKHDLISGEVAEAEEETEGEEYETDGEEKSGMSMKKKMPAGIAVLIGKAK